MISIRTLAASAASVALAGGLLMGAPAASANYAPQLPSTPATPGVRVPLSIEGAQPNCRVTFSIRRLGGQDNVDRGLVRRTRTAVNSQGEASSTLRAPSRPGRYQLITRVDNFPGQTGCTPSKVVQTIQVD